MLVRRSVLVALLTTALLSAVSCGSLYSADWPQWRGPNRDGKSDEKLGSTDWKASPPKLLWMTEGFGAGYASVSVGDGIIYTLGDVENGQAVIAASVEDGKILWKTLVTDSRPQHSYEGSRCTPTIDGNFLYVVSSNGAIVCLKTSGEVVWKREFSEWGGKMMSGWGFSESPLVDGDRVLCTPGGDDAAVVCLDKKTGKDIWVCKASFEGGSGQPGAGYSSIVISNAGNTKQYVQLVGQGLLGINAKTGKQLWSYSRVANGVANIPTPIVDGNLVFASTAYNTGTALVELKKSRNGFAADEKYFLEANVFNNHHGGMVLHNGHVYAGHQQNEGFPTCIELTSGKIVWGGKLRGAGKGSAAIVFVDGHLIFRYQNGTVALIEATPAEYRLKGSFMPEFQERESWAHPVVANGRLYLREQDKLMCYDLSN